MGKKEKKEKKEKKKDWCQREPTAHHFPHQVSHPSPDLAHCCLTFMIKRRKLQGFTHKPLSIWKPNYTFIIKWSWSRKEKIEKITIIFWSDRDQFTIMKKSDLDHDRHSMIADL